VQWGHGGSQGSESTAPHLLQTDMRTTSARKLIAEHLSKQIGAGRIIGRACQFNMKRQLIYFGAD
jgi:hypothetical protein